MDCSSPACNSTSDTREAYCHINLTSNHLPATISISVYYDDMNATCYVSYFVLDSINSTKNCSGSPVCEGVCEARLINRTSSSIEAGIFFFNNAKRRAMISCQQSSSLGLSDTCTLKCKLLNSS